jgi:hypothetical protein
MIRSNDQHRSWRLVAPLLAQLIFCNSVAVADAQKTEPFYIGDATMVDDGTITVNLRRTTDGRTVVGTVKYPVDDPHYREVLDHIGGMKPGETKLVPAWDDADRKN